MWGVFFPVLVRVMGKERHEGMGKERDELKGERWRVKSEGGKEGTLWALGGGMLVLLM